MSCPLRHRPLATAATALIAGIALGRALPWPALLCGAFLAGGSAFVFVWLFKKEKRKANLKRLLLAMLALLFGIGLVNFRTAYFSSAQPVEGTLTGRIVRINTSSAGKYLVLGDAQINGAAVEGKVRIFIEKEKETKPFRYGERVSAKSAKLKLPTAPTNPGGTDKRITLWSMGVRYNAYADTVDNHGGKGGFVGALFAFRETLEQTLCALMPADVYGVVEGMLFGGVSGMDEEWLDAFRATGIAHVLAVSGMNIAIVATVVLWLLKKVGVGRWAFIIALVVQALYCILAGFAISVVRAAIMTAILLFLKFNGERVDLASLLSAAAIAMLLLNPFVLFTPSFLLSFGAVLGIMLLYPPFFSMLNRGKLKDKKWYKPVAGGIAISAAAQLGTMPAQIAFFNAVPVLSIPLNLVIIPLVQVITIGGFVAALLGSIFLPLGIPFAFVIEICVRMMSAASVFASKIPFAVLTVGDLNPLLYAAIVLACGAIALYHKDRRRARLICLCLCALLFIGGIIPMMLDKRGAELTMLDVSEGDGFYLRAGNQSVLLDGGRLDDYHDDGKTVVLPYLRSRGVAKLDAIFVSHPHLDHCGGLVAVVEEMKVKRLYIGGTIGADKPFELLIDAAKRRGVEIIALEKGDEIEFGEMNISVIAPEEYTKYANESSLVLLMQYGEIKALLTGDADRAGEVNYISAVQEADILKVAHHGSKYGTGYELLNRVHPTIALISVGASNTYGHPGPKVLQRLKEAGAKVYRTDQHGAVRINILKDSVEVVPFR